MNCKNIDELINEIKKETQDIWVNEPLDIFNIKNGFLGSEAGVYEQYFSPLVMLSGEMRSLGIHTFADLNHFANHDSFDLEVLKIMTKRMIETDVGVISFFGLKRYGAILENFNELIDTIETKEKYIEVVKEIFTLTNRYQMWLHQIFPWGFSMNMKKKSPDYYRKIYERMSSK
ncbi:MAG: hypothetical protein SCJ93_13480 [Bacillota bacterium]|nr:hypothetical protein [Bacillota bacterium]